MRPFQLWCVPYRSLKCGCVSLFLSFSLCTVCLFQVFARFRKQIWKMFADVCLGFWLPNCFLRLEYVRLSATYTIVCIVACMCAQLCGLLLVWKKWANMQRCLWYVLCIFGKKLSPTKFLGWNFYDRNKNSGWLQLAMCNRRI